MHTTLTDLEQLLLLAVLRVADDAYGGALARELEQSAGRAVSLGTIYVTLTRLEERGLVQSWLGEPSPQRGGKAKRLYRVTPKGRAALEHARAVLDRMWDGIERGKAIPQRV